MKFTRHAALAGIAMLSACGGHSAQTSATAAPAVSLTTAKVGTYVRTVQAVGRVGAPAGTQSKLSFAGSGVLQAVDVQIGDRVSAGQALAQLDTGGLALAAAQAQADAQAASANVQQSQIDRFSTKLAVDRAAVRREESLYAAGVAPLKDVQAARAQLAADQADAATAHTQVAGARAQAQSAQDRAALAARDLGNGTLRAPSDGVVTAIYKRPGEAVDPSTPVIAVGPGRSNEVTLDVTAGDAARIHAGDRVTFAIPGTQLTGSGRIDGVSTAIDPATQTATVTASGFPGSAPAGSAVQATIDVKNERGVIIPQAAIVQDPQTGATLVFVQTRDEKGAMKFKARTVAVRAQNGAQALVSSGLRPGERIAAQGGFALLAPANTDD
ncbi:MAG TPA: HlyD family efflux transporter periplasmic adaptor subunit [Candidatus Baltobacteraceae bacterium]|nr:HlyD family efflux transporter periplasmic adaptor subunit [Candidatus Baltobacteraceae bacterium]